MEELPELKQYQIEIHTLGLYVSGNSYIVETVYSVRISVQTEQRLTSYLRLSSHRYYRPLSQHSCCHGFHIGGQTKKASQTISSQSDHT